MTPRTTTRRGRPVDARDGIDSTRVALVATEADEAERREFVAAFETETELDDFRFAVVE